MPLQVNDLVNKYNVRLFKSLTSIEEVMALDFRNTIKRANKIFDRAIRSSHWEAFATLAFAVGGVALDKGVGFIPNVAVAKQPMELINKIFPKIGEVSISCFMRPHSEKLKHIATTEREIMAQQHKEERQKLEHARQNMEDKIAKLQELEHASYRRT